MRPYLKDRDRTDLIVVHCSATDPKEDIGKREITQWHLKRGLVSIGYHYVIRRDGSTEVGRRENEIGAHVSGHNSNSIGVCMVGGVDAQGKPSDNFTEGQYNSLRVLLGHLTTRYAEAKVIGHRDLSRIMTRVSQVGTVGAAQALTPQRGFTMSTIRRARAS